MTTIPARTSDHHTLSQRLAARFRHLRADDSGMSTVEYSNDRRAHPLDGGGSTSVISPTGRDP